MLGQTVGFPVPTGGSGAIVDALCARLGAAGGDRAPQRGVAGHRRRADGRAHGVRLASGSGCRPAPCWPTSDAPQLYRELIDHRQLPPRLVEDLDRFQWDTSTLKINWALSAPIPWSAPDARKAGTVHLGVDLDGLPTYSTAVGHRPSRPSTRS